MPEGCEDAARGFYRDLLGLPEVAKPDSLAGRGGVWFERDGLRIHLGVEADFRPARKAHPAFMVDDLTSLVETLRGAGLEPTAGVALDGFDRVYVHDPIGNRLELMQPKAVVKRPPTVVQKR